MGGRQSLEEQLGKVLPSSPRQQGETEDTHRKACARSFSLACCSWLLSPSNPDHQFPHLRSTLETIPLLTQYFPRRCRYKSSFPCGLQVAKLDKISENVTQRQGPSADVYLQEGIQKLLWGHAGTKGYVFFLQFSSFLASCVWYVKGTTKGLELRVSLEMQTKALSHPQAKLQHNRSDRIKTDVKCHLKCVSQSESSEWTGQGLDTGVLVHLQ